MLDVEFIETGICKIWIHLFTPDTIALSCNVGNPMKASQILGGSSCKCASCLASSEIYPNIHPIMM